MNFKRLNLRQLAHPAKRAILVLMGKISTIYRYINLGVFCIFIVYLLGITFSY